jgi:hypothetical protein
MTIFSMPVIAVDGFSERNLPDHAQLQIEPRARLLEDIRDSPANRLPDGFLSRNSAVRVVLVPRTLRTIGNNVFSRMESLEEMDLSETGVEFIGDRFLFEAISVESCRFPATLRGIAFDSLSRTSIKRVDLFHSLLTELPAGFLSFSPVEVLLVPPTLQFVAFDALRMTSLSRLDWSHTQVRYIYKGVLSCSPLEELCLPQTVKRVAFSAFQHTQLRKLRVGDVEMQWVNEHLLDPEVRELRHPFCVTVIDLGALNGTQLHCINLSVSNLDLIDSNAICGNPCLKRVLFPRTLTSIQNNFLNRNPNLRSVDLRCTRV